MKIAGMWIPGSFNMGSMKIGYVWILGAFGGIEEP